MSTTVQIACAACGYGAEVETPPDGLPEALQCPMCGTWIRGFAAEVAAASQPTPALDADTSLNACLVESGSGNLDGQHVLSAVKTVVGRDRSDINIPDPTMSIHHFEIEFRGGEYFIRDLDSTNQTRVNGRRIETTTLQSGDRIQAGLTVLVFLAG